MNARLSLPKGMAVLASAIFAAGCGSSPDTADVGAARVAVNSVPSDGTVACIAVTATGGFATTQSFDVVPGQSTIFTLTGIPIGTVRFDGAAYPTACAQVTPMDVPTWVSTPVLTTVVIGQTTQVALNLNPSGGAGIGVGFNPSPQCRAAGMPCLAGNECCSGACGANNACLASAPMCAPLGAACAQPSDCCNGQCTNGLCQQPQCVAPSDCPGVDTECSVRACNAGTCGLVFMPPGVPISAQTPGDCLLSACDGTGNVMSIPDSTDVLPSPGPCLISICSGSIPMLLPAAAGTSCGPAAMCDGTGLCTPLAICGDGIVQPGEACDDGNPVNGDGCSVACNVEAGYSCAGSPSVCSPFAICGDGIVQPGEACDDGNFASGDGCSAICHVEAGFSCVGAPSVCMHLAICGNGIFEAGEQCDDGNTTSGDGCSAACQTEPGFLCFGAPTSCFPICGDGIIVAGEQCDDGNTANLDGCNSSCVIQFGYVCSGQPSVCGPVCGDGVAVGNETCDDGNAANGDGCSSTCQTEVGYTCQGSPSTCTFTCGNGIVGAGEQCDDGNTANGDGCSSTCQWETAAGIEPNDTTAQADAIAAAFPQLLINGDRAITGSIANSADKDIYKLVISANNTVVHLETFDSTGSDCLAALGMTTHNLRISSSAGVTMVTDAGSGIGACAAITYRLDAGTYYIQVDKSAALPFYHLEVRFLTFIGNEAEPNDTIGQASPTFPFPAKEVFGDHTSTTDDDYYAVTVPQGASIRAEIIEGDTSETCESNGIDSKITLYTSSGAVLGTDDDAGRGFCSLIDGTGATPAAPYAHALSAGTYFIKVASSSTAATASNQFKYRIAIVVR